MIRRYLKRISSFDRIVISVIFLVFFVFFSHPDLWETANHSYIFLQSLFSGKALSFYGIVAEHSNSFYYLNGANYNIFIYLIFSLALLPVFLLGKIFPVLVNEYLFIYFAKAVSLYFFLACAVKLEEICEGLGMSDGDSLNASLFFLLNPLSFYSCLIMGQYDSIGLFFLLAGLSRYLKKDMKKAMIYMGISTVCKFFALLVIIPLVFYAEKKLVKAAGYLLLSLWLYIPTTLLFLGRTAGSGSFTALMIERLFRTELPNGFAGVSLFLTVYAVIVFLSYIASSDDLGSVIYRIPLAVYGALFLTITWHPQWLIMLVPFMLLSIYEKSSMVRFPWMILLAIQSLGFFLMSYIHYPYGASAALFDGGVLHHVFGIYYSIIPDHVTLSHFMSLVPYLIDLAPVMFTGSTALLMMSALKTFPVRISRDFDVLNDKVCMYLVFAFGILGVWFLPSLLEWMNGLMLI